VARIEKPSSMQKISAMQRDLNQWTAAVGDIPEFDVFFVSGCFQNLAPTRL
jgi:hypothetical protein